MNADLVGFSFVEALVDMEQLMSELANRNAPKLPIIAKIETDRAVKNFLIIKMLQQQRHTGIDCRYPDYMDVMFTCLPWRLGSRQSLPERRTFYIS